MIIDLLYLNKNYALCQLQEIWDGNDEFLTSKIINYDPDEGFINLGVEEIEYFILGLSIDGTRLTSKYLSPMERLAMLNPFFDTRFIEQNNFRNGRLFIEEGDDFMNTLFDAFGNSFNFDPFRGRFNKLVTAPILTPSNVQDFAFFPQLISTNTDTIGKSAFVSIYCYAHRVAVNASSNVEDTLMPVFFKKTNLDSTFHSYVPGIDETENPVVGGGGLTLYRFYHNGLFIAGNTPLGTGSDFALNVTISLLQGSIQVHISPWFDGDVKFIKRGQSFVKDSKRVAWSFDHETLEAEISTW